jgi:hypothetical protein
MNHPSFEIDRIIRIFGKSLGFAPCGKLGFRRF